MVREDLGSSLTNVQIQVTLFFCYANPDVLLVLTSSVIPGLTTKNTVISPTFLVWKFCGKAEFPHSFGRITNSPHHKIR